MHVDEFVFRGRAEPERSAWHVVLAEESSDVHPVTKVPHPPRLYGPMPPEQAKEMGFPLPKILADINEQLLTDLAAERKKAEDLAEQLEQMGALLVEARTALVGRDKQLEAANAELGETQMRLRAVMQPVDG